MSHPFLPIKSPTIKNPLKKNLFEKPALMLSLVAITGLPLASHAQIEEVIVTAEKREANIQETPIAMSAFNEDALDTAGIDDALDIQFSVPNMLFSRGNFTAATFSIRGVGNSAVGVSADNGTGVHVNGVYLNNPRVFETEYYDVERVEVLRGPQGTLYGRNTTAGVINMITAKPTNEFGSNVSLSVGDYNDIRIKGMVNIPFGDAVSERIAVFSRDRDGMVENLYNGHDIDDRDLYSFRSTTSVQFSENFDATLMGMYFKEDDARSRVSKQMCIKDPAGVLGCLPTGLDTQVWNGNAGVSAPLGAIIGLLNAGQDEYGASVNPSNLRQVYADFDPQYFVEETIASLELNWHLNDLTLTSLSGYSNSYINTKTDYDWTVPSVSFNYPVVGYLIDGEHRVTATFDRPTDESSDDGEQISQEFRVVSDYDGMFNFTAGLFAMRYQSDNHYYVYFPIGYQWGQIFSLPEAQSLFDNHTKNYEMRTWALFGEGYFDLSDQTRLTVGLRYTDEYKETDARQLYLNFKSNITDPYTHQDNDWQEWTGKVAIDSNVDLSFTDDTLLYGIISRGYKGGGFNPAGFVAFPPTFDPEYVNSFEVGAKNTLADGRVQANLSLFYYDYKGLQVSKIIEQTSINENVDSTVSGLEGEFIFVPTDPLRIGLTVALLNAEIGDFSTFDPADPAQTGSAAGVVSIFGNNCLLPLTVPGTCTGNSPGVDVNLKGNKLPNSPKISANFNVEYQFDLGNVLNLTPRVQYYWQDDYYSRIFNTKKDKIDSWGLWDAQLTLADASDTWSLQVWGKNLGDKDYMTGQYLTDATSGLFTNVFLLEPRTYGLTFNYNFN